CRGEVCCEWEIRPSNRVLEQRCNLAFVPLMQNPKLLMQAGILVADVVGKYDLGEARISHDQFDVTQKHPSQHPDGRRMLLIATGFGPDVRKPVLQPP